MDEVLNAMGYSESDEERFLKVLGRGLLSRNESHAHRVPAGRGSKSIASPRCLSEAENWLEH
jgi:hypothetical protein